MMKGYSVAGNISPPSTKSGERGKYRKNGEEIKKTRSKKKKVGIPEDIKKAL